MADDQNLLDSRLARNGGMVSGRSTGYVDHVSGAPTDNAQAGAGWWRSHEEGIGGSKRMMDLHVYLRLALDAWGAVAALMLVLWLISLKTQNAAIVDVGWTLGLLI